MNDETYRKLIAEVLPNIPEDVREEWLLPASRNNGWPPKGMYWKGVLLERDIEFWKKTVWAKEEVDLENSLWSVKTNDALRQMNRGFHGDITTLFGTDNERNRVLSIMKHVFETGTVPRLISLLEVGNGFELADGHHRLLSIMKAREMINAINHIKASDDPSAVDSFLDKLRTKWGIENIAPLHQKHQVWVVRHPDPLT